MQIKHSSKIDMNLKLCQIKVIWHWVQVLTRDTPVSSITYFLLHWRAFHPLCWGNGKNEFIDSHYCFIKLTCEKVPIVEIIIILKKIFHPIVHCISPLWTDLGIIHASTKVTYPKYSKHWPYTAAHTIDCVCRKC